eukprot:9103198-Pyramimonas_sp.AAC.1
MQEIKVQDQPIGYNWIAPVPSGLRKLALDCTGSLRPQLLSDEVQRPCPRLVAIVDDDRLPPLRWS